MQRKSEWKREIKSKMERERRGRRVTYVCLYVLVYIASSAVDLFVKHDNKIHY